MDVYGKKIDLRLHLQKKKKMKITHVNRSGIKSLACLKSSSKFKL